MTAADQKRLLADVEAFCQEIRPIEELCYVEHRFNDQVMPLARKYNMLGMPVPTEYGGRGADTVTYARALARIGREGTGVRTFFSGHTSIGEYPILTWGNEEQKRRYLPAACRGEKILAFGLTEPDAGSNPLEMQTTYERRGDHFVLNGVKYLISNGGIADAVVVLRLSQGRRPHQCLHRRSRRPGFVSEDLTAKMGMPTANTAMFELSDCKVPASNLLGEEGDGFRIAMGTLVSGRLSVAAGCLGVIEDCLAEAVSYAKERQQHGKADRQASTGAGAHRRHRDGPAWRRRPWSERAAEAKDASNAAPADAELRGAGGTAGGAGEAVRRQRRLGRGRSRRAGLRRPRLVHALSRRPAPDGRARLPHLRGDRRDSQAEDRGSGAGQGVRGVQVR